MRAATPMTEMRTVDLPSPVNETINMRNMPFKFTRNILKPKKNPSDPDEFEETS